MAKVIAEVAKSLPKAAGMRHEKLVDASGIEVLDKSGFIDARYKQSS